MKEFYLDEQEKTRLRKLHESVLPDPEYQASYANFMQSLYHRYGVDKKRFMTVQTLPESLFGRVTVDLRRTRMEEVKKISKSDQPTV